MPYIIDGHNLIPFIPGLDLADPEDEIGLIAILQGFAGQRRAKIEVYFDQAPAAREGKQSHGLVQAFFIPSSSTADQAIKDRLSRLGKAAKNWTLVSSDREIRIEARSLHCQVLGSQEFAALLGTQGDTAPEADAKTVQPEISPDEVDYWMGRFGEK